MIDTNVAVAIPAAGRTWSGATKTSNTRSIHLTKPVDPRSLLEAVASLSRQPRRSEAFV